MGKPSLSKFYSETCHLLTILPCKEKIFQPSHLYFRFFIVFMVWIKLPFKLNFLCSTVSLKLKGCITCFRYWYQTLSILPLYGRRLSICIHIHMCTYANYLISLFSKWFLTCAFPSFCFHLVCVFFEVCIFIVIFTILMFLRAVIKKMATAQWSLNSF